MGTCLHTNSGVAPAAPITKTHKVMADSFSAVTFIVRCSCLLLAVGNHIFIQATYSTAIILAFLFFACTFSGGVGLGSTRAGLIRGSLPFPAASVW